MGDWDMSLVTHVQNGKQTWHTGEVCQCCCCDSNMPAVPIQHNEEQGQNFGMEARCDQEESSSGCELGLWGQLGCQRS